jgi:hypothetical protein
MERKRLVDLITDQAPTDYQEERQQKVQNPEHDLICVDPSGFHRPAVHVTEDIFNIPGIVMQDMEDVKPDFEKLLLEGKDCLIESKHYFHLHTPEGVITDDLSIIPKLENPRVIPFGEALATGRFLIELDLQGKGPLHEPNPEKDRNVDLGYCLLKDVSGNDVVKRVFIERVAKARWVDGKPTYHFHAHKGPRFYKPYRHLLDF